MGKLLKYYFKRDKWIILAMLALPLLASLTYFFLPKEVSLIIDSLTLGLSLTACAFIFLIRDYKRFYGEYSSFFGALPLKGKEIIGGRFIWFFFLGLWTCLILLTKGLLFFVQVLNPPELGLVYQDIYQILASLSPSAILFWVLAAFISLGASISLWLFVTSVGSEKFFRPLGIGGPFLVYVLIRILWTGVLFLLGKLLLDMGLVGMSLEGSQMAFSGMDKASLLWSGSSLFVTVLGSVALVLRSIYSHDVKLSTYL
ncbi:MAG: hypothetical protein Q4E37_05815 [Tissierellia bacterium]|nr:hypothetical protein [Tissierellia bacterium]